MRGLIAGIAFSLGLFAQADDRYLGVPRAEIVQVMDLGYNLDPKVVDLIEAMIRDYPESPMGICMKAARLFRLDDYAEGSDDALAEAFKKASKEAIAESKEFYDSHPDDPEARYALAMCELNLARYNIDHGRWVSGFFKARSGIGHLNGILKEHPDFHDAKMPLGVANCFLDDAPAYLKPIAMLLRFPGDMELGLQQLKDAEEKGFLTRYESLYYQVAVAWELQDDHEAAKEILERFLERFPRNVNAHVMRAFLDRKMENYDLAFERFEKVLSMPEVSYLKEEREWIVFQSGNTAMKLKDYDMALKRGTQLLDTVPEDRRRLTAWGHVLRGNALLHLERRPEAVEEFKKVVKSGRSDAYKTAQTILKQMRQDEKDAEKESLENK